MKELMRSFIVAGNWKMHYGPKDAAFFLQQLKNLKFHEDHQIIFFPPFVSWSEVSRGCLGTKWQWGFQNIYHQDKGAFTGEISLLMAKEVGAMHILVGHSERRHLFAESDALLADKVAAVQKQLLNPIFCIGESLKDREGNRTSEVVLKQIEIGLSKVDWKRSLVIAYEPVWAIGTGKVATPEQAQDVHALIRKKVADLAGPEKANNISILYGGSVKPENAAELSRQPDIDGFLVGGASLSAEQFTEISLRSAR